MKSLIITMLAPIGDAELVETLGWVFIHTLWQFSVIAIVLWFFDRFCLRNAKAKYALMATGMVFVVICPIVTWWSIGHGSDAFSQRIIRVVPSRFASRDISVDVLQQSSVSGVTSNSDAINTPWDGTIATPGDDRIHEARSAYARSSIVRTEDDFADRVRPWLSTIVACWMIGAVLLSGRFFLAWLTVQRICCAKYLPVPEPIDSILQSLKIRMRIRRSIQLFQSPTISSPIVVGCVRSVVLLPISFVSQVPLNQIEAILAHELAHVVRYDYVANLFQVVCETLFYYHPGVWWISHRLRTERENCCDDIAVLALGNRYQYGRALVTLAELNSRSIDLALGARGGSLIHRIRRLYIADLTSSHTSVVLNTGGFVFSLSTILALCTFVFWVDESYKTAKTIESSRSATLSNGIKVEMVAVGYHQYKPWFKPAWWRPNGSPFVDEPAANGLRTVHLMSVTNRKMQDTCREFVFRISGQFKAGENFGYQIITGPGEEEVHRAVMYGPTQFHTATSLQRALPSDSARLLIGFNEIPDFVHRSIGKDAKKQGLMSADPIVQRLDETIVPLRVCESNGICELVLQHYDRKLHPDGPMFVHAVPVAVDLQGQQHQPIRSEGRPDGFAWLYNVDLQKVDRFDYRISTYSDWISFDGIAMMPNIVSGLNVVTHSLAQWKGGDSQIKSRSEGNASQQNERATTSLTKSKADDGLLGATLQHGVRIELSGITGFRSLRPFTQPGSRERWWKPNGSVLEQAAASPVSNPLQGDESSIREFAFRLYGPEVESPSLNLVILMLHEADVESAISRSLRGPLWVDGNVPYVDYRVWGKFDNSTKMTSISVYYARGSAEVIGYIDRDGKTLSEAEAAFSEESTLKQHMPAITKFEVSPDGSGTRLKLEYAPGATRKIAYFVRPLSVSGLGVETSPAMLANQTEYFLTIPPNELDGFQITGMRLTHKLTFKNVALAPGDSTSPEVVVERLDLERH